jgi:hypothetical protein
LSSEPLRSRALVSTEAVGTNFKLWWQSIASLGNGNFFGQAIGFSTALTLVCAAMTIAAVVLAPRIAHGELARAFAARRRDPRVPGQSVRLAWCVFWTSLLVLLSTVFILSGIPEDLGSSRYLVGVIYAAAALVPLLGRRGPLTRAAVTAGATLYAFTGWLALAQHRIEPPPSPSDQLAGAVAKIASQERLSVGYAGYWDAAPITWATHLRVKVFPVDDCDGNQHLCAFELHVITSWVHAQAWSQDVPALRPRLSCCAVRADARSRQADRDSSDRVGHDVRVLVRHRHAPVRPLSGPGRRRPKSLLAPCCLSTQAALRRR